MLYKERDTTALLNAINKNVRDSVAVLAKTTFRSLWKSFIFIIKNYIYRVKVSKKWIM